MPEAEKLEGVNLTTITVNAASPDVIGAILKKITDEVMKAIPEGALEKIAKEVIASGKITWWRKSSNSWGNGSNEELSLADETKQRLGKLMEVTIHEQLTAYLATPEIRKIIADQVATGVQNALAELPRTTGKQFLERLTGQILGDTHMVQTHIGADLQSLADAVGRTQQALLQKGVLHYGEIPVVPVQP